MSIKEFLSPFGVSIVDKMLIVVFMACVFNVWYCSAVVSMQPVPIPIAARIVHYLLEVDSTACYGQNNSTNRTKKHEKDNLRDTGYSRISSDTLS